MTRFVSRTTLLVMTCVLLRTFTSYYDDDAVSVGRLTL